ncbi:MAG: VTT domain-containing protein [Xanthomonadales bacterium]|nr:VTT domain-containing protein [Xanthomonadales bacterium]
MPASGVPDTGKTAGEKPFLRPGETCWRIGHAERVRYLVDGEQFFPAFRAAALEAEHSILILGWDIHSEFKLLREAADDGFPVGLRDFLDALVERKKKLHVHVLAWDFAMILAPDREWAVSYKMGWKTHDRIHFQLDGNHPAGASHHQKVVVVDDRVGFAGGLDFTLGRWDSRQHRPDDPRRSDDGHEIPQPYHDVQLMVDGEAALCLGELARERWRVATGEKLAPPRSRPAHDPWPQSVAVDLEQIPVAVLRTLPACEDRPAVREVERLLVEAIERARECIYLENQYFTAPVIRDALVARLQEDDGPEVVVVLPEWTDGWLSQNTMDVLRERVLRCLFDADRHDRLRVYYPYQVGLDGQCINQHAKVTVVDERLLCAGSANLNNRSMGLDSECNLAIEDGGEEHRRAGIVLLRDRLLAEHLDVGIEKLREALGREASPIRAIESLRSSGRSLRPLELVVSKARDARIPETAIADPEHAIDREYLLGQLVAGEDKRPARRGLFTLAAILLLALLLAGAWRWTPLNEWVDARTLLERLAVLRGNWLAPLVVIGIYLIGGFLIFPVTLMIVGTGLAFGAVYGFFYALLGAEISALASYAIGQYVGHDAIRHLSDRWVSRASRYLGRQGLLAIVTLRIVPVAPFTVVNLVAGASHIGLRDFALGTLLGMLPGTLALVVLSDQIVSAIRSPDAARITLVVGLLILAGLLFWGLRYWVTKRETEES